jgi:DNA-directed RNA polymerase I, II, and III subunit RPABC1
MTNVKPNLLSFTTSRIFNSRKTICKFLKYRGFDTSEHDNNSMQEIHIMINNKLCDMTFKNDSKTIHVFYCLNKRLGEAHIRELFNVNDIKVEDDIIIIAKDLPNSTIKKLQENIYYNDNKFIIVFSLSNLQYNILEHSLVPKHVVLDELEKNTICEKFHILNDSEFPEISRFDPVAQAIGLRPSELCEITRSSKTAIDSKYYRMCV